MAVRIVFQQEPTEQQVQKQLRHFLARFFKINTDNRYVNLQLLPLVEGGGDHICNIAALGHGHAMDGYIRKKALTHYATKTGSVYSQTFTFRAQHDVWFSRLKNIMLPWLQEQHIFMNQETSAANLAPVGWIKGVSHRAANITTLAEELSQKCRASYNQHDDTFHPVSPAHRTKYGNSLGPEAFSLTANVSHLIEEEAHATVIQLSVHTVRQL
jgi:hypothetical protein